MEFSVVGEIILELAALVADIAVVAADEEVYIEQEDYIEQAE